MLLGELCEIVIGRTPSRIRPDFWGGTESWLSIADMGKSRRISVTEERISNRGAELFGNRRAVPGTVLLSFKLSVGKVGIADVPLYTNEAIAALPILDPSILFSEYLARYLEYVDLLPNADRAAMGNTLDLPKLRSIEIPVPPLPEQRRIASILDQADNLRVKRRRSLEEIDTVVDSIFNASFAASSTVLEPRLCEIARLSSGKFLPSKSMVSTGYVPVYGGNGVNGHHNEAMYSTRQIVIGRVGAYCGVVHVTEEASWVTDNALIVEWDRSCFDMTYLAVALRRANLNQFASQSGQPLISSSRLANVPIRQPSMKAQTEFSDAVQSVGATQSRMSKHLEKLDELFASLQYRAFRGEL